MRKALVPAVMTAFVGLAGSLLAMNGSTFAPFFALLPHDARTELPLLAALASLVFGAAVTAAVARRQGIARADDVAAVMLGLVAVALASYLAFAIRFWPAFAANRVTYGIDLADHGLPFDAAGVAVCIVLLWSVATVVGRRPPATAARRDLTVTLIGMTCITAALLSAGLHRMRAHPRGYLAELQRAPLPPGVGVGSVVRTEDLCVFGVAGDAKSLDVLVVRPEQPCPANGFSGERLAVSTTLLRDRAHDVWFRPSAYWGGGGYYSQLEGPRGIATLHDVGAPPPLGLVYAACIALGAAALLALEALRKKRAPPALGVAVVGLCALPLWVGAAVGVVL